MKERLTGKKQSFETIQKRILKLKGKKRTKVQKDLIALKTKEAMQNPLIIEKVKSKRKKWTEEQKQNLSKSRKGRIHSEQTKEKMRISYQKRKRKC